MTLSEYLQNPPKLVGPDYNIYYFTEGIYKVVKFKQPRDLTKSLKVSSKKSDSPNEKKFDSSYSRAKANVLELALCNDWGFFCTFTLDKTKYDRFNLDKFHFDFTQWIRDQRKKLKKVGQDLVINFLLVPEMHQDGAWHMHGLFSIPRRLLVPFYCERKQGMRVPDFLVDNGYLDWPDYRSKFGFCSFGIIKNKVAAGFYVSKYISKDLQNNGISVGSHLYFCSRGLERRKMHGSVYGSCDFLDFFLVNDYEFCKTGLTNISDGLDFTFGLEYMDPSDLQPMDIFSCSSPDQSEVERFEKYFEFVQCKFEGFV